MGLFVLRALRGLWGFCVREWLGGFGACCVFASIFSLFPCVCLSLSLVRSLVVFCLSSFLVLFVLVSLWVFVFSFSLSDVQTKRKGAIPCVLSCPVVSCFI